jgi:radical SAM protein with 4Fe4S-binding SPASM domain
MEALDQLCELLPQRIVFLVPPTVSVPILSSLVERALASDANRMTIASDLTIGVERFDFGSLDVDWVLKADIPRMDLQEFAQRIQPLPVGSHVQVVLDCGGANPVPYEAEARCHGLDFSELRVVETRQGMRKHNVVLPPCGPADFGFRSNRNACLGSVLTICNDGRVLTCPLLESLPLGEDFDIASALRSQEYDGLSRLTLDRIEPCRSCGLRTLCSDCRFVEMHAGARFDQTVSCDRFVKSEEVRL